MPEVSGVEERLHRRVARRVSPHRAPDDQEPKAVDVYRQTLAAAPDQSVTIISVGFLVNLADLLQSPADSFSPLTGVELVRKKVKELVVMGGHFPRGDGAEYNFGAFGAGPPRKRPSSIGPRRFSSADSRLAM